MIPSLFLSTLLGSAVFIALGLPFILKNPAWESRVRGFPRNEKAAWLLMGLGGLWFLYKITQLAQADFGDYKEILLVLFGGTLLGSFLWVKDFLAVRGMAVLILLASDIGLKSAYGNYEIEQRLIFVTILYLAIIMALYLGTLPFKLRDFFNWLYAKQGRARVLGYMFVGIGLALLMTAISY